MNPVRDATEADYPALVSLRNTPDLHAQYVRRADGKRTRFLVYEQGGQIVAFALLRLYQRLDDPRPTNLFLFHGPYQPLGFVVCLVSVYT